MNKYINARNTTNSNSKNTKQDKHQKQTNKHVNKTKQIQKQHTTT